MNSVQELKSDDLRAIGSQLLDLAGRLGQSTDVSAEDQALLVGRAILIAHAELRKSLGLGLVADPGMMILLELLIAAEQGLAVKRVVLSAGVPWATAHRWIERLERHGLIHREVNAADRRSSTLTLSAAGREVVTAGLLKGATCMSTR